MIKVNDQFLKLPESYLFSEVARKIREYKEQNPEKEVIRMDIGDVTLPLPAATIEAMHKAVDDQGEGGDFHGYGPEQGYQFLRDAIAANDYAARGCGIQADEIFVSDGAKSDLGNLGDILSNDCRIAVADPGYPVYVDATVISGRGGELKNGRWTGIEYLKCDRSTDFKPQLPEHEADVIILCSPSNPTGTAMNREELRQWVDYANRHGALIIYDSAYESYISSPDIPRSIYEIEGAEKCAIEVRSFSKTAGFTGIRCGYTVVPKTLKGVTSDGEEVELRKLWNRRQTTKFNGAGYISQRGAEAVYSEEGKRQVRANVEYYMENARLIRKTLEEMGFKVWGGENSPYVWASFGEKADSWELFDRLLREAQISCTPGSGFGANGAGFIRLTGFNTHEKTREAMRRLRQCL